MNEQEHTVMYPIDAIKVRNIYVRIMISGVMLIDRHADPNADPESDTLRSCQWHDTRRLPNSHGGGSPQFMARHVQCGGRSWYVDGMKLEVTSTESQPGPAHAVYFATYEAVKHLMGGNQAGVHHPLAAGMLI
jgi:hypothetical protein